MKRIYDVAVIGAGLAGLSAAYKLSDYTRDILLLERNGSVGNKVCGGLICKSVFDNIGIHFLRERILIDSCVAYFPNLKPVEFGFYPSLYSINRSLLDMRLYQSVKMKGLDIRFNRHIIGWEIRANYIHILDSVGNEYKTKFLIDASGVSSLTEKIYGWQTKKIGICIQATFPIDSLPSWFENLFVVYFNSKFLPYGYGWLIPKKDEIYIGLGIHSDYMTNSIKNYYEKFKKILEEKFSINLSSPKQISTGLVPLTISNLTCTEKVLIVGDAAGFVDPFWGGGCRYAVKSGFIAAEIIKNKLGRNGNDRNISLLDYERLWRTDFSNILEKSRNISRFYGNDVLLRENLIGYLENKNG